MKKRSLKYSKFLVIILTVCVFFGGSINSRAEEYGYRHFRNNDSYSDEYSYENPDEDYWNDDYSGYDDYDSYGNEDYEDSITIEEPEEPAVPGTYTVAPGWSEDEGQSTESTTIYLQDAFADEDTTSVISCSYLDTNYSISEYEQLRDMLTNNLLYDNVNAQISTSAVYTQAKDYLYIIVVDDPAEAYRDIYHYVVGDYICFCVQVKEIRLEAQKDEEQDQQTPEEAGLSMAESFTWN